MDDPLLWLTFVAAIGCGLSGGVFFAFSTFVMAGLKRLPAPQGAAAMQEINVMAVTPVFMLLLFGSALVSLAAMLVTALDWETPGSAYIIAGGAVYLAGCILLTIVFHVPRNGRLAALDPGTPEAADYWRRYLAEWVPGNHVRTIACVAAAAFLTGGLLTL